MKLGASVFTTILMSLTGAFAGDLSGTIRVQGFLPPAQEIDMSADSACIKINETKQLSEDALTGAKRGLKNVLVYLKDDIKPASEPPPEPIVLDQRKCKFIPRILLLRVGQKLKIRNGDPLLHNVHAKPKQNTAFNFGMPLQGMELTTVLTKPEIGIRVGCDIHPWMKAWIHVLSHSYGAVTDADGAFRIPALPAGRRTIGIWHELLGTQERVVTVNASEPVVLDVDFQAASGVGK